MSVPSSPFVDRAVRRARWLAELAAALDAVGKLAPALGAYRLAPDDSESLQLRLMTVQAEIDSLRKGHPQASEEIDRFWMK